MRAGHLLILAAVAIAREAAGQAEQLQRLSDLNAPVRLSAAELRELMPGATLSRSNTRGVSQSWTHGSDGTMDVQSVNRGGRNVVERGKWRVEDNGDYCVEIDWHNDKPERWCRPMVRAEGAYYTVDRSDRVRKYEIQRRR